MNQSSDKKLDPDCICHGNWRTLVQEVDHLIDRQFKDASGRVYTFYGLVHGEDDYYYGMSSPLGGVLLSCVGSLETHGFTLCEPRETGPYLTVTMPDGAIWGVPISLIARHRAEFYASPEFDGDVERSLNEDTRPLFEESPGAIQNWAVNNMDWDDFYPHQVILQRAPAPDFQKAWLEAPKGFSKDSGF